MRNIQVSTDLYATIWRRYQAGDRGEEDILRREFGMPSIVPDESPKPTEMIGFHDRRHDVGFAFDFEIFDAKKAHRPRARDGLWHLNGKAYHSLNQLTRAVGSGDSAWRFWRYNDVATGQEQPIDALKPEILRKARRRRWSNISDKSAAELGL